MNSIVKNLRTAVLATIGLTGIVSIVYPLLVWGSSQLLFSSKANGSLISKEGKIIGSELIGQNFSSPQYFHSRPSAAGKGYDAAASSGSNLGPISGKLLHGVSDDAATADADESFAGLQQRAKAYRETNGLGPLVKIPADAVTASGSGLDPHISPRNADLQLARVARVRGASEETIRSLIDQFTDGPDLGFLGEPGVNVLKLNVALDELQP
jgi:K+-transporting ATPase ATPase C chain